MPKQTRYLHFLKFWLPVYLYAGLIFISSSQSEPSFLPSILYLDKLLHLAEYVILGYLIARALKHSSLEELSAHFRLFTVCIAVLYGISDEFHQYFVPGRKVEALDIFADGVGSFLGQLLLKGKN